MKIVHIAVLVAVCSLKIIAQESPHGALNMQCTDCHSTEGWNEMAVPLRFDHASTSFYLYGQHRNTECKQCHTTLRFAGTPANCFSCHQKDYDAAIAVSHRNAAFSTECTQCHSVEAFSWRASFDHNKTQFPTRGAHEAVACKTCHAHDLYKGTPIHCIACHQQEYDATTNPNHRDAKFPTDCATCHRALTWQPAVFFPHDSYFPIGAGAKHRPGRWNSCSDCHTAQPNYNTFECINCHEHTKSKMDSEHQGEVNGYVYQSSACYRCHPQGVAED